MFNIVYTGFRGGGGVPGGRGGTFLHWRNKKICVFQTRKVFTNLKKSMKNLEFFENFKGKFALF